MGAGCKHDSVKKVWKIGKGIVFAGSRTQVESEIWQHGVDMLVDLCGGDVQGPFKVDKGAQELLKGYSALQNPNPPTLAIKWPDGGVPKVNATFWQDLVRFVRDGHKICVFCLGGHGRTGTALVSLAHFAGRKGDVLKEVRAIYCPCAVETSSQIKYLKDFGVETEESGSYGTSVGTWTSSGGWTGGGSTANPKATVVKKADVTDMVMGDCTIKGKTGTTTYKYHRVHPGMSSCIDCHMVVRDAPQQEKSTADYCQSGPHQGTKHLAVKEGGTWTCGHCGKVLERGTKLLPPVPSLGIPAMAPEKVPGECRMFQEHLVNPGESTCRDCGEDLREYFKEQGRKVAGEKVDSTPIQVQES